EWWASWCQLRGMVGFLALTHPTETIIATKLNRLTDTAVCRGPLGEATRPPAKGVWGTSPQQPSSINVNPP
ncbi:MAG: hypothetical protein WBA10_02570, partial [Elainellaceae cyanobacterium]